MKKLTGWLALAAMIVAYQAEAKTTSYSRSPSAYSSESSHKHVISPSLGFMGPGQNILVDGNNTGQLTLSGLFAIGGEYEYMLKPDLSVGGFIRYYDTSDSSGGTSLTETAFLLGGLAHAYLIDTNTWQGYVASGLTILNLKQKTGGVSVSPDMGFGIPLVMGLGYKINDQFTLGLEHMQVLALGEKINGWPISDLMIRLRIAL